MDNTLNEKINESEKVFDIDSPRILRSKKPKDTPNKRIITHINFDDENTKDEDENFNISRMIMFESQNIILSQLTQGSQQYGQFSYIQRKFLPDSIDRKQLLMLDKNYTKNEKCLDRINMAKSFFSSLENINNSVELIIANVQTSSLYFTYPETCTIFFLRKFLNYYSIMNYASIEFPQHLDDYIKFIKHLFVEIFANYETSYWQRNHLLSLFQTPNFTNENTFIFDLIEFQIDCMENIIKVENQHSWNRYRNNILFVSKLFSVITSFLLKDFENFLAISTNYFIDIASVNHDMKPLWVRLLWPFSKPEYMSRGAKYFIYLVVKALGIYFKFKKTNCFYANIFVTSLFQLLSLTAECIRIGSGNIRPYLKITSNRNLVAFELWCQLSQIKLTNNFSLIKLVLNSIDQPWLNVQFCIEVLNNRFVNLKHNLPSIIGRKSQKIKLSFKMIVLAFLTGNIEEFKIFYLKLIQKNRKQLNQNQEKKSIANYNLEEQRNFFKQFSLNRRIKQKKSNGRNEDDSDHQIYQRYLSNKTEYGGNSLHIAVRNNDSEAIGNLFRLTKPNLADFFGYTPLIDAVRFEHVECLQKLIEESKKSDIELNFEAGVVKQERYTALHYAIIIGNREIIRLLLENGGQHLLYIESADGQTPEDLIETNELKKFISSIQYQKKPCCLPNFELLAKDQNVEVILLVKQYCLLINIIIQNYLATIRINQFKIDFKLENFTDPSQIKKDYQEILAAEFSKIFQRSPTELEIDFLFDDFCVLFNFSDYVQTFCNELEKQNIHYISPKEFFSINYHINSYLNSL